MSPLSLDWIVYSWLLLRFVSNNILLRSVCLMLPVSLDWIVYSWLLLRFVSNNILLRSVCLMLPVSLDWTVYSWLLLRFVANIYYLLLIVIFTLKSTTGGIKKRTIYTLRHTFSIVSFPYIFSVTSKTFIILEYE
jgi:hypothetical protein